MKIKGTKDSDHLVGTSGGDVIRGGRGDDWIIANGGDDVLFGGRGADTFIITPDSFATIVNFKSGVDSIIIDAGLYGGGPGGGPREVSADDIGFNDPVLSYEGVTVAAVYGVDSLVFGDLLIG